MPGELEVKILQRGEVEELLKGEEEAVLLFPSVWAAQDAQMRYVREGGAVVGGRFSTMGSLAERIYLLAGEVPSRLGLAGEVLLLKEVLEEDDELKGLHGGREDAVEILLDAYHRAIRMMRQAAVSPGELERVSQRASENLSRRVKCLAEVYSRYLERMADMGVTDEVGYLKGAALRAERLLKSGMLPKKYLLLGFYDISMAQADLLNGLLKGGGHLTLYLREGWSPYAEPLRLQFRRIEDITGMKLSLPLGGSSKISVKEVHAHPSIQAELKWAMRWVRRELREGTPPQRMAIVVRSVDAYINQAMILAERYSVPLSVASHEGLPIRSTPAVKLVIEMVRAAWLDSPRESVLPLLSSPLVNRWLRIEGYPEMDLLLRERGFEEGTEELRRVLEAGGASPGALRLVELLENMRGEEKLSAHLRNIMDIILNLYEVLEGWGVEDQWRRINLEALSRLHSELFRITGRVQGKGGPGDVYDILDRVASLTRISPMIFTPEGVALCSFRELIPLGREKVVFLGLDQEFVPAPFRGVPLFSPEEANWLSRMLGREIFLSADYHILQEKFLLEALLSGVKECWISFRYLDSRGRVNLPTPFITGTIKESNVVKWSIKDSLMPPLEVVENPGELRLTLLKELREGREVRGPGLKEMVERAERRSRGERQRRDGRSLGVYDGVLREGEMLKELSQWGTERRPLSSVTLEEYGTCPMRFFFHQILGLEPLPEVEAEPTPLTLGTIIHGILHELFKDFERLKEATVEELQDMLLPHLKRSLSRFRRETAHHLRRRFMNPSKGLVAFLEGHLKEMRDKGRVPIGTEMEFEAKGERALRLPGGESVAVVGRVDRVDLAGEELHVVDYKSGSSYGYRFMDSCHLQLPLYLNVLKNLTGRRVGGGEYLFTTYPFRVISSKPSNLHRDLERSLKYVEVYTRLIREGLFPPLPQDPLSWYRSREILITPAPERCRYCPYKEACRIEVCTGRVAQSVIAGGGGGG